MKIDVFQYVFHCPPSSRLITAFFGNAHDVSVKSVPPQPWYALGAG